MDELLIRHEAQRTRVRIGKGRGSESGVAPPAPPSVYTEVAYFRRSTARKRPVHGFALTWDDEYRSFDPRRTIEVSGWLRHAAHECARGLKLDPEFIERFVCGHGEGATAKNARFSYLPLPTIPVEGRDGRIRRVLVAEPFGGGGREAQAVARRLAGAPLVAQHTGEVMADLRPRASDGVVARYLRQSRIWGTATPLVLPGRDDHRSRKACGLVLKAGYSTPVTEIHLQAEPVFPGAEMARAYRVPAYLKEFPRTHAIITFAEAVPGPVAIGGGRHLGLGIFAGLKSPKE